MPQGLGKFLLNEVRRILALRQGISKSILLFLIFSLFICPETIFARSAKRPNFSDKSNRAKHVARLSKKKTAAKNRAFNWARMHNKPMRIEIGGRFFELMDVNDGKPLYYVTYNRNAAISSTANLVRQTAPYYADGNGFTVGLWDAGTALSTHQELTGRITLKNAVASNWHSTHVAGTIAASGINSVAKGMASAVHIDSYDWDYDTVEMAAAAASYPNESGKIYASNHSYGSVAGWVWTDWSGTTAWHWSSFADWNDEDSYESLFGQYDAEAGDNDQVAYNAPYYLIFKAAGNDRNDNPPAGSTVYYSTNSGAIWHQITYSTSTCPLGDGIVKSGYDTIADVGVAKNIMTVGAVNDAVSGGVRNLSNATMASFSSWGPADDGRIKPDIVANGVVLNSCDNDSDTDYTTASGTSMASPSACGSAMLLVDYYDQLYPGQAMRSSSLKGLIIHTADDLGNAGPDYKNGWGLMNTKAAADLIKDHNDCTGNENMLNEDLLDAGKNSWTYTFDNFSQGDVKVTLCWTDPAASGITTHDNNSPRLINDLDLRIVARNGGQTYYPYILNPDNPSQTATTGDNTLDNIEQVYVSSLPAGTYNIQVSHKGTLTGGEQYFSLISSVPFGPERFDISGNVKVSDANLPGVTMAGLNVVTDANGNYNGSVDTGWSGTVTPLLTGYTFVDANTAYSNVISNQVTDYTATLNSYTISGNIKYGDANLADVNMVGFDVFTDANGNYIAEVDYGWSGIVTPSLIPYVFSDSSTAYSSVSSSKVRDYSAIYSIQLAINASDPGATVDVPAGIYNENIVIDVNDLTLFGSVVGDANTAINGVDPNSDIITVTADRVTVDGFYITAAGLDANYVTAILLNKVNDCNITNNILADCNYGVVMISAANSVLIDNTIRNNTDIGIYADVNSISNIVTNNNISANGFGLVNSNFNEYLNARNNWWGDASGPLDDSNDIAQGGLYNPSAQGDKVSDYVDYALWLLNRPENLEDIIDIFDNWLTAGPAGDLNSDGIVNLLDLSFLALRW